MRPSNKFLAVVICLCSLVGGDALAQNTDRAKDDRAVRDLVAAYQQAREQRDTAKLNAILAPDADQLVSSGEWRKGQEDLVRGMLASSEQNSGTRTLEVHSVRFIGKDAAVADAHYNIAGANGGQARRMASTFVVSRAGAVWRIEAIRNMAPTSAR